MFLCPSCALRSAKPSAEFLLLLLIKHETALMTWHVCQLQPAHSAAASLPELTLQTLLLNGLCCLPSSNFLLGKSEAARIWHRWPLNHGQDLCLQHWSLIWKCKWCSTPLQMRSSGSPVGCCTLLKRLWGRGSLWEGSMVDLDGYGNGQTHYTALYSSLPFPVVPSDCPLKDKLKLAVYRPLPWSPTPPRLYDSHLQDGAEINGCQSGRQSSGDDVRSLSWNSEGVPVDGTLCPDLSLSKQLSSIFYGTVDTARLRWVFCGGCNQIVSIRGLRNDTMCD